MIPVAQLKQNLQFSDSLRGIIDVLKIAASVQLRQMQSKTYLYEPFANHVADSLRLLDVAGTSHPFLVDRGEERPACLVVLTANEGFSGGLNAMLINATLDARNRARGDELVVLGERGASALEELNESFVYIAQGAEEIDRTAVHQLQGYLVNEYLSGKFGRIRVVYAKFVNIAFQQVEQEQLLPTRATSPSETPSPRRACFIEPSADRVIEGLVSLWLEFTLAKMLVSSKLSEFSARVMHLEGSDQELSRMTQQLAFQYAKHLHLLADKAIREISTSRLKVAH